MTDLYRFNPNKKQDILKYQSIRKRRNLVNTLKALGSLTLAFGLVIYASNSDYKTKRLEKLNNKFENTSIVQNAVIDSLEVK